MSTITPPITCARCGGSGEIQAPELVPERLRKYGSPVPVRPCGCAASTSVVRELDVVWPGLGTAEAAPRSLFRRMADLDQVDVDLVICAPFVALRAHLRAVLEDDADRRIDTRVVSDAELLTAAFSKEVGQRAQDLYLGPGLLVLVLGVQRAKHPMLSGLVLTALAARDQRDAPTWVVFERQIGLGDPCWSPALQALLSKRAGVRFASAADPGAPLKLDASQAQEPAAAPASAPQAEMSAQVAEGAGRLGWTPDEIDHKGNAWGRCLIKDCTGRFSVFMGNTGRRAMCHEPACKLHKARAVDEVLKVVARQGAGPAPSASAGSTRLSTLDLLARELRCGAGGGVGVLPEDLPRSKSALEKSLLKLRGRGHKIDSEQGPDRKYRWVCRE